MNNTYVLIYVEFISSPFSSMKHYNNAQFFKSLILWVFGLAFAGILYANLDIPTNISNAVQTIKEIRLTTDGQSSSTPTLRLNGNPAAGEATLQISGNIIAGSYSGAERNSIN